MRPMLFIVFLISILSLDARAEFNRCRWTIEGTNADFATDASNNEPPQIVSSKLCATPGGDSTATPTICQGKIYCEDGTRPPFTGVVACAAQDMGNGKFACPSASVCAQDETVLVDYTKKIPSPRISRPGGGTGSGSGAGNAEGQRQGGGR